MSLSVSSNKIYFWIKILSTFGIVLAIYLLYEQITQSPFAPCNINATVNCNAIISGPVAKTFGIPTPLIGLTGYVVILISAFLKKSKLILAMATFGLVFCLWIAYRDLFELHTICPACILCQLDMISVFALGFVLNRKQGVKND